MAKNILITLSMDAQDAIKGAQAGTASVAELTSAITELQQTAKSREGLRDLGVAMQDASEATHQLRSGVDDVVEQLNLFGDAGADLVAEINKISDPMKRVAAAQRLMANQSSITGGAVQRFNNALVAGKLRIATLVGGMGNLSLLLGGVGVAAGAAAGGFGLLVAAVNKYIDSNAQAQYRVKELTTAFDNFVNAIGQVAFNIPVVQNGMTFLIKQFTELRREIDGTTAAKRRFVEEGIAREKGSSTDERAKAYKGALRPGDDPLLAMAYAQQDDRVVQDKYAKQFEDQLDKQKAGTERRKKLLAALNPAQQEYIKLHGADLITRELYTKEMERLLREEGRSVDSVERLTQLRELGLISASSARKQLKRLTAKTDDGRKKAAVEEARKRLGFDWRYGAGTQAEGAASREAERLPTFVPGRATPQDGYADPTLGPGLREGDNFVKELEKRMTALKQEAQVTVDTSNSTSRVLRANAEIDARYEQERIDRIAAMTAQWANFAGSFVENSARIATALSGQGGAWRAWHKSGLQAISGLASLFGDFFITWGSAQVAINPFTAAIAIAGGLALKALAGVASGASDRLGDKGRSATTASNVPQPTAPQREKDRKPEVINLYMDGNRVGEGLRGPLQRMARNGQLLIPATTR